MEPLPATLDEATSPPTGTPPLPPAGDALDASRRQQAMVALGRRAVARPDLTVLMQDVASLLGEMFGADGSGITEMIDDDKALRLRLFRRPVGDAPAVEKSFRLSTRGEDSLAGYVLETSQAAVSENIWVEKRFIDAVLKKEGFRAAIAAPLKLQGESFGAVAAYSDRQDHFTHDDALFIESIAHLVATTIGRCRLEDELRHQRSYTDGMLRTVNAMVVVLDAQWRVTHINQAGEQLTGFRLAEIRARPIRTVFSAPGEDDLFGRLAAEIVRPGEPAEYESFLLTKHGDRRRIAWRYQALPGIGGHPETIIATGMDVTDQVEAEQRIQQAEQAAAEARRELNELASDGGGIPGFEGGAGSPINSERRRRPRRSYPFQQSLAYVRDGRKPDDKAFFPIECHDIAPGGFSFYSSKPPVSDAVVVALGRGVNLTHLLAHVAHVTRLKQDGRPAYLIGCSYSGRVSMV